MRKILILCIIILFNLSAQNANTFENRIIYKIDNEIITSYDINNQFKYLSILNPKLLDLDEKTIFEVSEISIIKEKIKKIEINRNLKSLKTIDNDYFEKILKNYFTQLGFETKDKFESHLIQSNLKIEEFREKITIEALWSQLIYQKYKERLKIDENEIKRKILNEINKNIVTYNLSEIIFNIENNESFEGKFKFIKDKINQNGFESTAMMYSVSQSSNIGGKLGWVNENSINLKIIDEIKRLEKGNYTKPITIPGGFLILKLNDYKTIKNNSDIDIDAKVNEFKNLIIQEQLDQFSNIHYNKLKKNLKIEKKI